MCWIWWRMNWACARAILRESPIRNSLEKRILEKRNNNSKESVKQQELFIELLRDALLLSFYMHVCYIALARLYIALHIHGVTIAFYFVSICNFFFRLIIVVGSKRAIAFSNSSAQAYSSNEAYCKWVSLSARKHSSGIFSSSILFFSFVLLDQRWLNEDFYSIQKKKFQLVCT